MLTRKADGILRPAGYLYGTSADPDAFSEISQTYDSAGRLSTVTYQRIPGAGSPPAAQTFTYGYNYTLSGGYHVAAGGGGTSPSDLPFSIAGPAHVVERSYETTRDSLRAIANKTTGGTLRSSYTYGVNDIGQRTGVTQAGSAFPTADAVGWAYNAKGEVVSADATSLGANDRYYSYDGLGNRLQSRTGTATSTGGTPTDYYADASATTSGANVLNQYEAIKTGGVTREPVHDDDGNLTGDDKKWQYTWDGENRLISAETYPGDPGPARIEYSYDHLGRCFRRRVMSWNGSAWVTATTMGYMYDGWNRIASTSPSNTWNEECIWGLDLSGTQQGAGGVGGLLLWSRIYGGGSWESYYPAYDGNGNVTDMLNTSGAVVAHWEYDAFGNTTYQTPGSWPSVASEFVFRFSTKQVDLHTGMYYYGYRYYDPKTGRWPSRDPITELAFREWFKRYEPIELHERMDSLLRAAPYAFVLNQPLRFVDPMGLQFFEGYSAGGSLHQHVANDRKKQKEDREKHLNRNKNNECPNSEPTPGVKDSKGRDWTRDDPAGEKMFHGGLKCFRHNHFQCCYCKGKLVDSGPHQGTYDYEKFDPKTGKGRWPHFLEDVLPHWSMGSGYTDNQTTTYD